MSNPFKVFRKTYIYYRVSPGSYQDGLWVEGNAESREFEASIQPRGRNLAAQLEGRIDSDEVDIYTDEELKTVEEDEKNPDIVIFKNRQYEVTSVHNWQNDIITHYKYIATLVNKEKQYEFNQD